MIVNKFNADPITNARLSNACWNGFHAVSNQDLTQCTGWLTEVGDIVHIKEPCECYCHYKEHRKRIKKDKSAQMDITESGCGVIEIK